MKWIIRIGIITVGIPSLYIGVLMLARFRPGRGHIHAEIEIHRAPSQVFRWISREDLMQQWVGGMSEISLVAPGPNGGALGERFHLTNFDKEENSRIEMDMTVTEYLPSQRLGMQIRAVGNTGEGFIQNAEYRISPAPDGSELVVQIQTNYYGRLPQAFEPMITRASQQKVQSDLARLKKLVESEAVDPTSDAH